MTGAEIAAIATAITTIIGLAYKIGHAVAEKKHDNWVKKEQSLEQQLSEAQSDEERRKLLKALSDHRSSNK